MNKKTHQLLNDVDRAIIRLRGVYSAWSKKHGISYNEMLVLYTIRDNGYCTQKITSLLYMSARVRVLPSASVSSGSSI